MIFARKIVLRLLEEWPLLMNPATTLARDAMFAVIMNVLNGMVGLTLLIGALKYKEQDYNLQGANAFLAVILPLTVIRLVLPNYTQSPPTRLFRLPAVHFPALTADPGPAVPALHICGLGNSRLRNYRFSVG